jgi:hypothetical protein
MTPFAKEVFDSLPKIDDLIKPLTAEKVFALMEGRAFPDDRGKLYSWNKPSLPEYQSDLLKGARKTKRTNPGACIGSAAQHFNH